MAQPIVQILKLSPSEAARRLRTKAGSAWLKQFRDSLDIKKAPSDLRMIMDTWALNASSMARLFGVSRQALSKWLKNGIPSERRLAVANLATATNILIRHIKPERIPAVVRRAADKLGGKSLMDLAAENRSKELLTACREMFTFEKAHT